MLWQYDVKLSQSQAWNFLPLESRPSQDPAALDPDNPADQPHLNGSSPTTPVTSEG